MNSTEELLTEIRAGRMVILVDDEDRENEGDFVMAATHVRADDINFMARYGRGLICLTLTKAHCDRLNLPLMSGHSHDLDKTNFTVSIEAAEGVTTGISAADRALTIQTAVAESTTADDLVQPGHIFPIMAHPGGVLIRAGHTEAGCDLVRLSGLTPASVIVEILKDDGMMARRPDLEKIAQQHDLKIGTIADLIRFRVENERTVERVAEYDWPTDIGIFKLVAYQDALGGDLHFALIKNDIDPDSPVLVRVHLENPLCDLTRSNNLERGWPIQDSLSQISKQGGVFVILCNQISAAEQLEKLTAIHKVSLTDSNVSKKQEAKDLRTYGLGAQILADLGVKKMRVMSAPRRLNALSGFGLEVVEYVS